MIIDCISDLHGHYPELEGGDILIVAGDIAGKDIPSAFREFKEWIENTDYKKRIVIAGNHDNMFEGMPVLVKSCESFEYLCDSGTEFTHEYDDIELEMCGIHPTVEETIKIWGSPWTLSFPGMNPNCKAFTVDTEEELAEKWRLIPDDIDILITHSPPYGVLDHVVDESEYDNPLRHCGSFTLRKKILELENIKLHVFGHIHENGGLKTRFYKSSYSSVKNSCLYVNACIMNEQYQPVNKPVRIEL